MIKKAWALLGLLPLFSGASFILGHLTGWATLTHINTLYIAFTFNAAICFVLLGLALCVAVFDFEVRKQIQILLGLCIFIVATLTISQDFFEMDLNIDQFFVAQLAKPFNGAQSGRMAPNTAMGFILSGLVLMMLPFAKRKIIGISVEIFIFILFLISALGLSGYILKLDFLYSWYNYTRMALASSVNFFSVSMCFAGIWRGSVASVSLYQGREDTRIMLLSSAILLCMALAVTLANFASLINQQSAVLGQSFQQLQKGRSLFFENEIIHAIDETNVMRSSQVFQDQINQAKQNISVADFGPILKLFAAEGFSAVDIYAANKKKIAGMGQFNEKADFNLKKKITNGFINILWKNGWYVQIATDVDPRNKTGDLLIVEWPLRNVDKVFSPSQMVGKTGDIVICMPASDANATCFSSRANAVSVQPQRYNNQATPEYFALHGQTGLMTADDEKYNQVLVAYGPIDRLDLGMMVKMALSEIDEPIVKSLRTMLPVIALTILVGLLLLRLQVVPLIQRVINAEKGLINSNKRLQTSEERYALAVRGSSIGLWDWDIAKDQVFYSPYFKGMLGYSDVEFANTLEAFKNILHPDDVTRVFDSIKQHINHQTPYDIEFRLRRKTGDYHWFHVKGLALWDENGRAIRMAGSMLDVTERKRSERRMMAQYTVSKLLSESENIEEIADKVVQLLSENMEWDFGSIWLVDSRTSLIRCIGLWHQPGLEAQALIDVMRNMELPIGSGLVGRVWESGQPLWSFDVTTDKDFFRAELVKTADLHSAFCFPIRIENKVLGVLEFFVKQRQSPDEAMLKVMSAISMQIGSFIRRKVAETRLRESESYKAAILESVSDSIMTISESGLILSFNQKTLDIFGYTSVELTNKNIDILIADLSKNLKKLVGKLAIEAQAVRKDQTKISVEITISNMVMSRQNVFVCILRDVAERKRMEERQMSFQYAPVEDVLESEPAVGRLLICDSDADQASCLQALLESAGYTSDIVATVADAKKQLRERQYLVLLLDLVLSDQNGITFIRELHKDDAYDIPVIVMSVATEEERTKLNGEIVSVIDWLDKPVDFNKLLRSIDYFKTTSTRSMPRILHVEEDASVRQLVASLLHEYATVVEADSIKSARRLLESERFDLVIIDLLLSDGNGVDLLPILASNQQPVIIFSSVELDALNARQVKEVLVKSKTSSDQLLEKIKKWLVIRG